MRTTTRFTLIAMLLALPMHAALAEVYFGANIGGNLATVSKNINYNGTNSSLSDKYYGLRGQILVGYNMRGTTETGYNDENTWVDDAYIAVEADANYNMGRATASIYPWFLTNEASVREDLQYSGDVFALLKYRVQPKIVLFVGPGLSRGQLEVKSTSVTGGNLGVTGDFTKAVSGWSVKGGIEVAMSNCSSIVATYQYSDFNTMSWTTIEPLTGDTVQASYKPVVNSLTVGVSYNFF